MQVDLLLLSRHKQAILNKPLVIPGSSQDFSSLDTTVSQLMRPHRLINCRVGSNMFKSCATPEVRWSQKSSVRKHSAQLLSTKGLFYLQYVNKQNMFPQLFLNQGLFDQWPKSTIKVMASTLDPVISSDWQQYHSSVMSFLNISQQVKPVRIGLSSHSRTIATDRSKTATRLASLKSWNFAYHSWGGQTVHVFLQGEWASADASW